jgi:Ca-activated chloride channel homolog
MVAELATAAVVLLAIAAEYLHARRCRRVAGLAFGPENRPARWVLAAPLLRMLAIGCTCWGLATLLLLQPKVHKIGEIEEGEYRHLLLVLDVSPSMRLEDAGPTRKESRMKRAAALLTSFFERVPMERYRVSVIAVYTGAKPVVLDTRDLEVVRNILSDLPMHHAFTPGPTDMFSGLVEAAKVAKPWQPGSTTLVLISDGDTVPATGMPAMPTSIRHVLVIGVGDAQTGTYIDGHQSRQDSSTLRQVAARLNGVYHDGNEKQIPTDVLRGVTFFTGKAKLEQLGAREYALMACGGGASVLALLPVLLHFLGTRWRPGVQKKTQGVYKGASAGVSLGD